MDPPAYAPAAIFSKPNANRAGRPRAGPALARADPALGTESQTVKEKKRTGLLRPGEAEANVDELVV